MSSPFKSIEVTPDYYAGDAVTWTLDPTFSDTAPFLFTLETSDTPDFSTLVSSVVSTSGFHAVDNSRRRQTLSPNYYFRVKLETGSGKTYYSRAHTYTNFNIGAHKYWMCRDIVRREYVRFRFVGFAGHVLKRKNYGERHKESTTRLSGVSLVETSPVIGTEFEGGYHPAFPVQASIESSKSIFRSNDNGDGIDNFLVASFRLPGFPALQAKDILVVNHERYNLENVEKIVFPGTGVTLVQTAEGRLLPPTDPVYTVPVNESHFEV